MAVGIVVTRSPSSTFSKNVTTLFNKCKQDMNRWISLSLSLVGRANLIKMTVLPKFLYLFQNIPFLIKKSFFKTLDRSIVSFLWGNKPSRISRTHLQKPKALGGLALPNFLFYYWTCNIQKLIHWLEDKTAAEKVDWVQLEFLSNRYHLGSVVCAVLPLLSNNLSHNLIVNHSIRLWAQCRRHFGLQGTSILSPVKSNHMFTPSCTDPVFAQWFNKGIRAIHDLYIEDTFASFSQLSQNFDLPMNPFFRYLQIRSFVQRHLCNFQKSLLNHTLTIFLAWVQTIKDRYPKSITLLVASRHTQQKI